MSTKHYGLSAYGLHLTDSDVLTIYKNYYKEEPDADSSIYDVLWKLYEAGLIDFESTFTGEAFGLDKDGSPEWCDVLEYYSSEALAYVQLACQPSLLKRPYHDMDEAIEEMRNAMDGLLPDGFDYRRNLCLILGTYYG